MNESNSIVLSEKKLALAQQEPIGLKDIVATAIYFAKSGYFGDKVSVSQAVTKIFAGLELGIGPFTSMAAIHVIEGKPCLSANLLATLCRRDGHYDYSVKEITNDQCVLEFFAVSEGADGNHYRLIGVSTFTIADAKLAEVAHKKNWRTFPRNMLFARALSNGVRWFCPEVTFGTPVYVPEEFGYDSTDSISSKDKDEKLTYEVAAKIVNSKGQSYGQMTTDEVKAAKVALESFVEEHPKDEKATEAKFRIEALGLILAYREEHPDNGASIDTSKPVEEMPVVTGELVEETKPVEVVKPENNDAVKE